MNVRVLLADDVPLMRVGLRLLLEGLPLVTVVGEAADAEQTLQMVRDLGPDLVMLDLGLPGIEEWQVIPQIRLRHQLARVVAMSMKADRHQATGALKAGAIGYLLKSCAADEVGMAIRSVMAGNVYLSPHVADMIVDHYVRNGSNGSNGEANLRRALTLRERKVLQLVADGMTSKEIARTLTVSVKTVDTHRQQIMSKLGIRSIARLTKYAVREGLSPLEL